MTTNDSGHISELYDGLNERYEEAYKHNHLKLSIVSSAIGYLTRRQPSKDSTRILDVGCGTGIPVSELSAKEGFDVYGFDISPEMVRLARAKVSGTFEENDMVEYQPRQIYAAVFVIFSQLHFRYAQLHAAIWKLVQALEPNGLLVIGQAPADKYVENEGKFESGTAYYEDCHIPFFGKPCPTLAMTEKGQREFLTNMGLVILQEIRGTFQPKDEACAEEEQQYIIAQRPEEIMLTETEPMPEPYWRLDLV